MSFNPNPYYRPNVEPRRSEPREPQVRWAKLPRAPITGSPVPHLTSLYHDDDPGPFGDRSWPGNCGGNLIRDLLLYFKPEKVFDGMAGSGTCGDVCRSLGIDCLSGDIHAGFDMCDPANFHGETRVINKHSFDFVWLHPAYWRMKLYAADERDLSRAPTLDAFLERYAQAIAHAAYILKPGGKLAVLMGDYFDKAVGFTPLVYHTKRLAFKAGLRQCCTDIVRFSHGNSSSRKVYAKALIPGLHDICAIFEKSRGGTS